MKIKIKDKDYFIQWRYEYGLINRANTVIETRRTFCSIRIIDGTKEVKEKIVPNYKTVLEKSVYSVDLDTSTRLKDRKLSLNKVIKIFEDKQDRKIIWNEYLKSQRGYIGNIRPKVKNLVRMISKLNQEDRERLLKHFESPISAKIVGMSQISESAHA